jgi:acylphosphatase
MTRKRVAVHGRVQGVWFRESARRRATELGLAGWVRNRSDGAVEAEIEGDEEAVGMLVAWFGHGPSGARVERLDVDQREPRGESGFTVTR